MPALFAPRSLWLPVCALALASASGAAPTSDAAEKVTPQRVAASDPMDVLRKRLAAKLGAVQAVGADSAGTLRIVARSTGAAHSDDEPASAAPARPPRRVPVAGRTEHASHWGYTDAAAWGRLKPEFSKCATGTRQSPIDLRDGLRVDLDPVRFDYRPSAFRVIDNGHTVQVNLAPGNSIEVGTRRFELLQFHFHRPSEERIDGRQFEMVAHLVHKDLEGRLAVVALLFERGPAQAVVQSVWNNLPLEKHEEQVASGLLDVATLLPAERRYFTYMGSLTTPPCSEGVLWMVLKAPVALSAEQIGIFARLYPMNARPIQSASGRLVKESN